MSNTETVEVKDYNILRESEKAMLIEKDNREYWIPKSQLISVSGGEGMPDSIVIPKWLADKKGLVPNDVDTRVACPASVEEANVLENQRKASADYRDYLADNIASPEEQAELFAAYENSHNPQD